MNRARDLYKRLLAFYPTAFREQFAESMEQTFNDLYREKRQTRQGLLGFVLWTFVETSSGILREHFLQLRQGDVMQALLKNLRLSCTISLLLILPFMLMEVVKRRDSNQGFPIPLFISMWVLPVMFILILMPIVQNMRAGGRFLAHPIRLLLSVSFLILIAAVWTGALIDQMPCFLGVPNCD